MASGDGATRTVTCAALGIDIGKVVMAGDNDALFGRQPGLWTQDDEKRMLAIPEVDGAVEAIGRLVLLFGAENVYLVSKAFKNTEAKTHRWLLHNDFCSRTGLLESHAWFCRARPDKAVICQQLGIGYFVDDRPDVLFPMEGTVLYRYLFGPQMHDAPRGVIEVPNWAAAEKAIGEDFPQ